MHHWIQLGKPYYKRRTWACDNTPTDTERADTAGSDTTMESQRKGMLQSAEQAIIKLIKLRQGFEKVSRTKVNFQNELACLRYDTDTRSDARTDKDLMLTFSGKAQQFVLTMDGN